MIKFDFSSPEMQKEMESEIKFEPLPEGEYLVSIWEVTPGEYKSQANAGKPNIRVQLRVHEGEFAGRFLWETIPLFDKWGSGKPAYSFPNFFKAIGLWQKEFASMEELKGKTLGVKLSVQPDDWAYNRAVELYQEQVSDWENGPHADDPDAKPVEPRQEDYKQNRIKSYSKAVSGAKGATITGVPGLPKF